ncbi:MAG: NAD-dependent epimerase/dehydratase family protein, partial [Candidatus Micrarchaeota archaeon]
MASILITGGAGFIGSNLAEAFSKEHSVTVLDNFSTGKKSNLAGLKVKVIRGDICDQKKVREAVKGIDYVIHLAAIASVPRSIANPSETNRVNAGGTVNLLFESARAEVDRFIFASSSAVYGNAPGLPKKENMLLVPVSPYASTKLAGEKFCSFFEHNFGLFTISFRYFNVYGKKQDPNSEYAAVIPKFIKLMKKGKRPTVFGDGLQTRDFAYVKDITRANELVLESKKGAGESINIASGEAVSINELIKTLNRSLGTELA